MYILLFAIEGVALGRGIDEDRVGGVGAPSLVDNVVPENAIC